MATIAAPGPPNGSRVLACVLCQNRKIKCDRRSPCSNCIKANTTCIPSTPAPVRKRRHVQRDVHERLARCEDLLRQYADGSVPSPKARAATDDDQPEAPDSFQTDSGAPPVLHGPGRMVTDASGEHFVGSHLLGRVQEELQSMKHIIDADDVDEKSPLESEEWSPESNDSFLPLPGGESNRIHGSVEHLQPEAAHIFRLWQLFLDRVNPLNKLIHVPSVQPYVMEAGMNMDNVPLNYRALLFSIFTMATVAISDYESIQMFGTSRDDNIRKFTQGTTAMLARLDFLRSYNMVTLQSLLLYLLSLKDQNDKHAAWILSGMVVRIAQKMGYHRDGESLNLAPFETEMRRRIWWQVVLQDTQANLASGLSHAQINTLWDTKMPLNLNDADLFPGSTEPLQSREGPTEMAMCLIGYHIAKFFIAAGSIQGSNDLGTALMGDELLGERDSSSKLRMERYHQLLTDLDGQLIDVEKRYIDANAGNVHVAALTLRPMIISKMRPMLVPMKEQPEWGTEILNVNDNLFKILIMNIEHCTDVYDIMDKTGFLWFFKLRFQLDILTAMTGQLLQRPVGVLADRAWSLMETIYRYHPELFDMTQKPYYKQGQFVLRAWAAREQAFSITGVPLLYPDPIQRIREAIGNASGDSTPATQSSKGQPTVLPQQFVDIDQSVGGYFDFSAFNWDVLQ